MARLDGRIAVVTGAARGIGAAIAARLLDEGATVVLADVIPELEAAVDALRAGGRPAEAVHADVSEPESINALVAGMAGRHGRIDILVNNAGISPKKDGRKFFVEEMGLDDWDRVMKVNLTGAFLLSQASLPLLRRSRAGRIVNIISQSARTRPAVTSGHYAASKAGLMGFSRALANEVGPEGITVNSVAPGMIETPMFAAYTEEQRRERVKAIPIPRFGTPEDVAAAVAFLASDDASYITGTVIDVNGGLFMT